MNISSTLLKQLDTEIARLQAEVARLQSARDLISGGEATAPKRGRGRPKGSVNAVIAPIATRRKKRKPMSEEARAKIAAAQKKRWAAAAKKAEK